MTEHEIRARSFHERDTIKSMANRLVRASCKFRTYSVKTKEARVMKICPETMAEPSNYNS